MIRTVTMTHVETRKIIRFQTALDDRFLARMFPGWHVITRQ